MFRQCVASGFLFALFVAGSPAHAQEWENPREVYGSGWGCASMQQGNPTYEICKRCDAEGGTFMWKTPPDADWLNEKLDQYEGRCDSADAAVEEGGNDDEDSPSGADVVLPETDVACGDGMLQCPDGQCYAIDSLQACCSWGGSCSRGNICWAMSTGSLCCKVGEKPTDKGCHDVGASTWITRRPGFGPDATETVTQPQEAQAQPQAQPKAPSPYVDLTVCNKTSDDLSAAMGFREKPGDEIWTFRGWWNFEPGECKDFRFLKGYTYFHGVSDAGKWGKDARFCVRSKKFSYLRDGVGDCSERSELFSERLLDTDTYRWEFTD